MNTETMTLREALTQKKLLDKQIYDLSSANYIAVTTKDTKVLCGLSVEDYKKGVEERWQSLSDKIKRRVAIDNAILKANVEHTVDVPKFVSLDKISTDGETEKISYASAIARKNYYNGILLQIAGGFEGYLNRNVREYNKLKDDVICKIDTRLGQEFGSATNASAKQRSERQAELENTWEAQFIDPAELAKKAPSIKTAIEEYLAKIDSILGHATEVTDVTFEY